MDEPVAKLAEKVGLDAARPEGQTAERPRQAVLSRARPTSTPDARRRSVARKTAIRVVVSAGALVLLAAQLALPGLRLDAIALGLVALAVLPWLSSIVESAKLPGGWEVRFRGVELEQAKQRDDLDLVLRFLLENFLTKYELVHLEKLAAAAPFHFSKSSTFEAELRRLLALGLIQRKTGKGIRSLFDASDDVHRHLEITARGLQYLQHRSALTEESETNGDVDEP